MKNTLSSSTTAATTIFLIFLVAAAPLTGCAALGSGIQIITDPALLEIFQNLQILIDQYSTALENPELEDLARTEIETRCRELCEQAHTVLDRLAMLGYDVQAEDWRKELPHKWRSSNSEPSSSAPAAR